MWLGVFWGLLCALTAPALATVQLEISSRPDGFGEVVREQIQNGSWDSFEIPIRIGNKHVVLGEDSFSGLNPLQQSTVLSQIHSVFKADEINPDSFQPWVNLSQPDLRREPALIRLGIAFDRLVQNPWAEQLLSSFARKWAKKPSAEDGPNCFHTSLASIFESWERPRYMKPSELLCHLKHSFTQVSKAEKWGDLILYSDRYGDPVHAFTYLGVEHENPSREIVFTKNGYRRNYYNFMEMKAVVRIYSNEADVLTYYRPHSEPVDPASGKKSPCAKEYSDGDWGLVTETENGFANYVARRLKEKGETIFVAP